MTLARFLKGVPPQRLFEDVGRVTGHFKPTLRMTFQDWATEWREDAERLIISFSRPDAILKADFTREQVNAFLDFVEGHDLYEFYWRWRSLNERAFSGDSARGGPLPQPRQRTALAGRAGSAQALFPPGARGVGHSPTRREADPAHLRNGGANGRRQSRLYLAAAGACRSSNGVSLLCQVDRRRRSSPRGGQAQSAVQRDGAERLIGRHFSMEGVVDLIFPRKSAVFGAFHGIFFPRRINNTIKSIT